MKPDPIAPNLFVHATSHWLVLSACALGTSLLLVAVGCNKPAESATVVTAPVPALTVGTEIDDDVVTTRVKAALLADASVKSFDVAAVTRKGEVQLSGFVDSQAQIDKVLAIVGAVEGVHSVSNQMAIKK